MFTFLMVSLGHYPRWTPPTITPPRRSPPGHYPRYGGGGGGNAMFP